jgi:hypothetical protein
MNIQFSQFGVYTSKIPQENIKQLLEEIEKIKNDPSNSTLWNNHLAGNIRKQFKLLDCHDHMEKVLMPYVAECDKKVNYAESIDVLKQGYPLYLTDIWVNFQQKYEFNPLHTHSGVYSFVIWIKIPYKIEDEIKLSPGYDCNMPLAGTFNFYYTNDLGKICYYTIPADSTYENTIVIFPSRLNHCVYPFYSSDEYRISVSGNFKIKVD